MLRLVLYYDVFQHPLTLAELARLAGQDPCEPLDELARRGLVEVRAEHVCLFGRAAHIDRRRERARAAERLWPAAQRAAAFLAGFPWVRAVLVTGGLSKQSASPGGDVDFLLLVEPGSVWTAKSALQALRRVLPRRARECLCTNYLLATDRLELDDRNMFTAMELATAVPLHGAALCTALLEANGWAHRYVPGLPWSVERARNAPTHLPGPAARLLEGLATPAVERAAARTWDTYWNRKYAWLDGRTRDQRFKRRAEIATNHLHDFQGWVLGEYERRCEHAGVAPS